MENVIRLLCGSESDEAKAFSARMIRKPNIILDLDDADFIKVIPLSEHQRKNVELPMQEDPIQGNFEKNFFVHYKTNQILGNFLLKIQGVVIRKETKSP